MNQPKKPLKRRMIAFYRKRFPALFGRVSRPVGGGSQRASTSGQAAAKLSHSAPAKPAPGSAKAPQTRASNPTSDFPLDAAPGIEGRLGKLNPIEFAGWAYRPDRPSERLQLAFYDGERFFSTAVADHPRPKLVGKKKGDGNCGFNVPIPNSFRDGKPHEL